MWVKSGGKRVGEEELESQWETGTINKKANSFGRQGKKGTDARLQGESNNLKKKGKGARASWEENPIRRLSGN